MTNVDLIKKAKELKLKNFRGVFMIDELKTLKPKIIECGIFNLNTTKQPGSHWVCWFKNENEKFYFDSYGLVPPMEIVNYLHRPIITNTTQLQSFSETICGQYCLYVLKSLSISKKSALMENFINICVN